MATKSKIPPNDGGKKNIEVQGEDENFEYSHPGACSSNRFPLDALLRKNGFSIWERRKNNEPLWKKHNVIFRQSEAVLRIDRTDIADAVYLDQLFSEGY